MGFVTITNGGKTLTVSECAKKDIFAGWTVVTPIVKENDNKASTDIKHKVKVDKDINIEVHKPISEMTNRELKDYAINNNITLEKGMSREDVLNVLSKLETVEN